MEGKGGEGIEGGGKRLGGNTKLNYTVFLSLKNKINYANGWPPPFGKIVQRAIGKELYYTLCKGPGAIVRAGK